MPSAATRRAEVVIVGAGPAGVSCALWCAELGLGCVLIDASEQIGGQLWQIPHVVKNLPFSPDAHPARLADTLRAQLSGALVELLLGHAAKLHPHTPVVDVDGQRIEGDAVVLATGVRRRRLGVDGEERLRGRSVFSNVGADPARFAGRRVVVVGGGDDAMVHVSLLAPLASSLTVMHRRGTITARPALRDEALRAPGVRWMPGAVVTRFDGREALSAVHFEQQGRAGVLDADVVFVCVGPTPCSEGFGVARRGDGTIVVDRLQRTSRAGVFAVGDVACTESPTIATALGHGATAAKAIAAIRHGALDLSERRSGRRDTLRIMGLRTLARVGAYAREQGLLQRLRFDVSFAVDAGPAAGSDRLEHTIDYAAVARVIEDVVARGHHHLIEAIADSVARELLARFDVAEVEVEVTKLGVPQRGSAAAIVVRRTRGDVL